MKRTERLTVTGFLAMASLLATSAAHAQDPEVRQVVVWPVAQKKLGGKPAKKMVKTLSAKLTDAGGWEVVKPKGKQKKLLKRTAKKCKPPGSSECMAKLGGELELPFVLAAQIQGKKKNLELVLTLFDVQGNAALASVTGSISKKTVEEDAAAMVEQLLTQAGAATDPPPGVDVGEGAGVGVGGDDAAPAPPAPPDGEAIAAAEGEAEGAGAETEAEGAPEGGETIAAAEEGAATGDGDQPDTAAAGEEAGDMETIDAASVDSTEVPTVDETETVTVVDGGDKPTAGVGLLVALMVPSAQTGDVTFGAGLQPSGSRTATFAVLLEGRYYLPDPVRDIGFSVEVGWYSLGQRAERSNSVDPDFSDFSVDTSMQILPVLVGPVYRLPPFLPEALGVEMHVGAGFAYQYLWSTTSYTAGGQTTDNATQSDSGLGYYFGAEGGLRLGPGLATATVRYMSARTDLAFVDIYAGVYNEELGDTGGTSLLVGYRLEL